MLTGKLTPDAHACLAKPLLCGSVCQIPHDAARMTRFLALSLLVFFATACTDAPEAPASRVFFESPADGATVQSPVAVVMGAEGVTIAPAGTMEPDTGHFHIIVDQPFVAAGSVVPADSAHIHFGTGATTASLDLTPGEHVLRLQLADGAHIAMDGLQSEIRITVE